MKYGARIIAKAPDVSVSVWPGENGITCVRAEGYNEQGEFVYLTVLLDRFAALALAGALERRGLPDESALARDVEPGRSPHVNVLVAADALERWVSGQSLTDMCIAMEDGNTPLSNLMQAVQAWRSVPSGAEGGE